MTYARTGAPVFAELAPVSLRAEQTTRDGRAMPVGTAGTVVEVLGRGTAYVVEFLRPVHALLTAEARQLEPRREG